MAWSGAARRRAARFPDISLTHRTGVLAAGARILAEIGDDRRREAGDRHVAAQRNLFNRLLGCLHHCLTTRQTHDPAKAFPTPAVAGA